VLGHHVKGSNVWKAVVIDIGYIGAHAGIALVPGRPGNTVRESAVMVVHPELVVGKEIGGSKKLRSICRQHRGRAIGTSCR